DLVPVEDVVWEPGDAVVMVDSQPKTGRHTFADSVPLYAVIDHHDTPGDLDGVPFTDIRASHGATCTVVTKYLREQDVPIPEQAAEVVDFMIRFEQVDWAVCGGVHNDQLILSVRAAIPDAHAGDVLRQVVGRLGKAGGHDRRAGGAIKLPSTAPTAIEDIQS